MRARLREPGHLLLCDRASSVMRQGRHVRRQAQQLVADIFHQYAVVNISIVSPDGGVDVLPADGRVRTDAEPCAAHNPAVWLPVVDARRIVDRNGQRVRGAQLRCDIEVVVRITAFMLTDQFPV